MIVLMSVPFEIDLSLDGDDIVDDDARGVVVVVVVVPEDNDDAEAVESPSKSLLAFSNRSRVSFRSCCN